MGRGKKNRAAATSPAQSSEGPRQTAAGNFHICKAAMNKTCAENDGDVVVVAFSNMSLGPAEILGEERCCFLIAPRNAQDTKSVISLLHKNVSSFPEITKEEALLMLQ
ncbi:unnamed protein product [Durusdinium trenchii]|uniref:Uncharacterized protein n=1 Tax=Durusdinium trenchii TaxID=1381693 RepID=A0ABP0HFQ1_9DINO